MVSSNNSSTNSWRLSSSCVLDSFRKIGSFAVWGTVFSACDCTLTHFRKKVFGVLLSINCCQEDPWNAIIAGGVTGGILAARAGPKAAMKNAVIGSVILALIEGISIGVQRVLMPMYEKQAVQQGMTIDMLDPPVDPLMRHSTRNNPRDIQNPYSSLQPSTLTASLPGVSGGGFDLSAVSSFDNTADDWQKSNENQSSSEVPAPTSKSWWSW
jgi:hypothetical protein